MRVGAALIGSLVTVLLVSASSVPARAALTIGESAPSKGVKMKNVDGRELSIADVAGEKGTLVIFTCNHCPYAKAWEKRIATIGNTYTTSGIGVISINPNDPEAYPEDGFEVMQERARDLGMKFPYVVDGTSEVARTFGATKTPEAFLFNASGKLVYHGTIDDNYKDAEKVESPYLKDALDALLAGREVPAPRTKALGCSIKFR